MWLLLGTFRRAVAAMPARNQRASHAVSAGSAVSSILHALSVHDTGPFVRGRGRSRRGGHGHRSQTVLRGGRRGRAVPAAYVPSWLALSIGISSFVVCAVPSLMLLHAVICCYFSFMAFALPHAQACWSFCLCCWDFSVS